MLLDFAYVVFLLTSMQCVMYLRIAKEEEYLLLFCIVYIKILVFVVISVQKGCFFLQVIQVKQKYISE